MFDFGTKKRVDKEVDMKGLDAIEQLPVLVDWSTHGQRLSSRMTMMMAMPKSSSILLLAS